VLPDCPQGERVNGLKSGAALLRLLPEFIVLVSELGAKGIDFYGCIASRCLV
jgi:hypothetical protein